MRAKDIRLAMRAVLSEFEVAHAAISRFHFSIIDDPTILLTFPFDRSDIRTCARRLEITYFLRMFAVFEGGLRDIWQRALGKTTQPRAHDLLDAIAARLHIRGPTLLHAHAVRDYRNAVIHNARQTPSIPLPQCHDILATYLSEIPSTW
jgi:hypothetical protein